MFNYRFTVALELEYGLKVVDNVSRIVYAVILIFSIWVVSTVSDFLTRLCQTTRNEVSFLLMPTWLKYTTVQRRLVTYHVSL